MEAPFELFMASCQGDIMVDFAEQKPLDYRE